MISSDKFLENVQSIFDETPKEQITLMTKFRDLEEWSSLSILGLIVTIEENFSFLLSASQIEEAETFNDLLDIIKSKNVI